MASSHPIPGGAIEFLRIRFLRGGGISPRQKAYSSSGIILPHALTAGKQCARSGLRTTFPPPETPRPLRRKLRLPGYCTVIVTLVEEVIDAFVESVPVSVNT